MAEEDFNLDMSIESVEISYSVPEAMMQDMAPDTPPIHVTSYRQVGYLLEITKTHGVRLCVSNRSKMRSRSKMRTVSEEREEVNEAGGEEDDGEKDDGEEDDGEEQDEEVDDGEEDDGEEDADICDVAEAVEDGENYSVYGKVKDEDSEEDDMCFEDFKETYAIEGERFQRDKLHVNQSFVSKDALVSEVRLTSVRRGFTFRIYKSSKTLIVAICRVSGCGWRLRASVKHGTNTFWVTKYVQAHTCSVGDRIAQRKHCTPKYVARLFIDRVGIIDGLNLQHITDAMKNMFGMMLNYTTSYRALLYAQMLVRRSAEDGYSRLPSYLEKRRVIVVDGTHLSGKYGGVMLVAAAQDGNFQIFPLAFGIVDAEDGPSWEWFFTKLASCISHDSPLVIVSDRHEAIKSAAYAHTVSDFDRYMAEIRSANPDFATYLVNADVSLWSRVYCTGDRYNIKTRNIAESINSALKRARGFPIDFLLEFIREKLGRWFWKRRDDALSLPTQNSRGVEYLLAVRSEIADKMRAQPIDGWKFFVKGGKMDCDTQRIYILVIDKRLRHAHAFLQM
ncbi:uncharacterized protein LOC108845025 [Raphanus sativus]|uniref:Uncharacterized protein LOC108845025 n=1 Tax=Raphanus sativus TaxID=3726 RepID=A0A9W3D8M8_RAPSA|nr:uncharacterized protein LOC108845025 [Raphanus sativus]